MPFNPPELRRRCYWVGRQWRERPADRLPDRAAVERLPARAENIALQSIFDDVEQLASAVGADGVGQDDLQDRRTAAAGAHDVEHAGRLAMRVR